MSSYLLSQHARTTPDSLYVFNGDYTKMYKVPSDAIAHTPAEDLHITRLVVCRNYQPCKPRSCAAGDRCKFVHIDRPLELLDPPATIHVNYCYHHQDECIYPRLPAGEILNVHMASSSSRSVDVVPSDCVLATHGALNQRHHGQLTHCAHYAASKFCKRGPDCHFIHVIAVDPQTVPPGHFCRDSRGRTLANSGSSSLFITLPKLNRLPSAQPTHHEASNAALAKPPAAAASSSHHQGPPHYDLPPHLDVYGTLAQTVTPNAFISPLTALAAALCPKPLMAIGEDLDAYDPTPYFFTQAQA